MTDLAQIAALAASPRRYDPRTPTGFLAPLRARLEASDGTGEDFAP